MTFKEKLREVFPVRNEYNYDTLVTNFCPYNFFGDKHGRLCNTKFEGDNICDACWNREYKEVLNE